MASSSDIRGTEATVSTAPSDVLLVEDEGLFARAVAARLRKAGYECRIAGRLAAAEEAMREKEPALLLLDMRLPDGSGLEFLERLNRGEESRVPVIVMTAYGEVEDAVEAMKLNASDYLKKPIDLDELLLNIAKVMANHRVTRQLQYSKTREGNVGEEVEIIGELNGMQHLLEQISTIGKLSAEADVIPPTVLITGETGTGKDVTARSLHRQSSRRAQPFVHVDCASLPKDLIEAELFGHVKGAFTGAHVERTGLIEAAEDGVVFLDEIGELPLPLQAKLLAVLERRTLRRVGSSLERRTNAWFIAATNRDVGAMLGDGALRADLYFRLNVLTLALPPLRRRGADVVALAYHFGQQTARRYGFAAFSLDAGAERALRDYSWPGNVRELKHLVERAVLLNGGAPLGADSLMLTAGELRKPDQPAPELRGMTLEQAERFLIQEALERTSGNVSEAARQLGVTRMAMRYRMKKHGLA